MASSETAFNEDDYDGEMEQDTPSQGEESFDVPIVKHQSVINPMVNCSKEVKSESEVTPLLEPIMKNDIIDLENESLDADVEVETDGMNFLVLHLEDDPMSTSAVNLGTGPVEDQEMEGDDPLVSYIGCESSIPCRRCDAQLSGEAELKEHLLLVHKVKVGPRRKTKGVYPCPYCDRTYPYPSKLNEHLVSHTHEKKFSCDICWKGFSRLGDMYKHRSTHVGSRELKRVVQQELKGEYWCFDCNKVFQYPSKLKEHLPKHIRKNPVRKKDEFFTFSELMSTSTSNNGGDLVETPETEVEIQETKGEPLESEVETEETIGWNLETEVETQETISGNLETEVETEETIGGNLETEVDTQETIGGNLETEVETQETIGGNLESEVETEETKSEALETEVETEETKSEALGTEVETQETEGEIRETEGGTQETESKSREMDGETQKMVSDYPLVSYIGYDGRCFCRHCDEVLAGEAELKEHLINVHTEKLGPQKKIKGVYPCPHCDKSYWYPSKLNEHLVCHVGEKKYSCDICLKRFSRNGDMYKHRSRHVGLALKRVRELQGEYRCFECNKVFLWQSELKAHLPSHDVRKKKSYTCRSCNQTFDGCHS